MADVQLEYPYKPRPLIMLFCILFFGAGALMMGHEAMTNAAGLIINGIIRLGVEGATWFFWGMTAVSALFVVAGLFGLVNSATSKKSVRLTSQELLMPRTAFARAPTSIAVSDIVDVRTQQIQRQRFLNVYHRSGKVTIAQSLLPNAEAFEKLHATLLAVMPKK